MKKRMVWLAAFLTSLLFSISAFASPPPVSPPPHTAAEVPVPAHTVPVVTNVQISGDTITMGVSGTYDTGEIMIYAITSSGKTPVFLSLTTAGAGFTGTVAGLPADTTSWELQWVYVYNTGLPDAYINFLYYADGSLQGYTIQETPVYVLFSFDSQGRLSSYNTDNMAAIYGEDGRLTQYTITTPTGQQRYNGQNELEFEVINDTAAGTTSELTYKNGVLMSRYVTDADNNQYIYDGQGVLRRSIVDDGSGQIVVNLYDANGILYSYGTETGSEFAQYDAQGNLIRKGYFDGTSTVIETYVNGQVANRTVLGVLPDGLHYKDVYENGVYTQRTVYKDDGAYHYDADGNYLGKTVYGEDGIYVPFILGALSEYQEFNAQGVLTEYQVYSDQQGGVYLTYNHRRALQSVIYVDPYFEDIYRYDAKKKVWYLNEAPYDGPVPIVLSELALEKEIVWYPNNTVCSFGPQFRDVNPDLTDKWYMFTPIDLSHDGTQTFELVGGSVYVLGQVNVTVSGDSVTVTYSTVKGKHGNIYTKSEYLNFFPDIASVKTVNPEELGEGFSFNQTISIQKDLGGDTNVLMFVRNVATFCNFVDKDTLLRRFFKNLPSRVDLRNAMLDLMD